MRWQPRPDQQQVLDFALARDKLAVYSPTGGGKTAIAGTWLLDLMYDRCVCPRVLIVAPKLVAQSGWTKQFATWDHLRSLLGDSRVITARDLGMVAAIEVTGKLPNSKPRRVPRSRLAEVDPDLFTTRGSSFTFADKRATKKHLQSLRERVHIVSWDFFPWLVKAYGVNWPYQGVVFDESSFLREQSSERGTAARFIALNLKAVQYQLQLTGTPNHNHGDAIWAQINLLAPGLLGDTLTDFRMEWCVPDSVNRGTGQVYSWRINPSRQNELNARVSAVAVSVPSALATPLLTVRQGVDMPEAARTAYDAMEHDWVWSSVTAGSAAVVHSKLRQMANGFAYDDNEQVLFLHNAKMDRLEELVESIPGPVLVGFEFEEELRRIQACFGKHVRDIRQRGAKDAFEAGKLKVLAVHPASAGHGVDGLQGATNQLIWSSVPQDRELYDQLNGRVHRTGTKAETVYCHHLVANGTREERILDDVLPGKLTVAQAFLTGVRVPPGKVGP